MNSLPSNWTGRFARTSREAFGHQVEFDRHDPDRLVGVVVGVCIVFVLGMLVGGAL
jgi:hypothetical protein